MKLELSGEVLLEVVRPCITTTSPIDLDIEISDSERDKLLKLFPEGEESIEHNMLEEEMPELFLRIEVAAIKECERRCAYPPIIFIFDISRRSCEDN